jgi:hypothetical protein
MHGLYGLQQLGLKFELKGGTSLSKGHQIIQRFSEDIDIRIEPPAELDVKTGRSQNSPAQAESRKKFYDWLAETIRIDGIVEVARDTAFDDKQYRSGASLVAIISLIAYITVDSGDHHERRSIDNPDRERHGRSARTPAGAQARARDERPVGDDQGSAAQDSGRDGVCIDRGCEARFRGACDRRHSRG